MGAGSCATYNSIYDWPCTRKLGLPMSSGAKASSLAEVQLKACHKCQAAGNPNPAGPSIVPII